MGLDIELYIKDSFGDRFVIHSEIIDHNLTEIAKELQIFKYLCPADELNVKQGKDLIDPLTKGLMKLIENPFFFINLNSEHGVRNGKSNNIEMKELLSTFLGMCQRFPDSFLWSKEFT